MGKYTEETIDQLKNMNMGLYASEWKKELIEVAKGNGHITLIINDGLVYGKNIKVMHEKKKIEYKLTDDEAKTLIDNFQNASERLSYSEGFTDNGMSVHGIKRKGKLLRRIWPLLWILENVPM